MLNLNEEWKKAYAAYLEEQEASRPSFDDELNEALDELNRAHDEANKSFKLIEDYFSIFAESEGIIESVLTEDETEAAVGTSAAASSNSETNRNSRQNSNNRTSQNNSRSNNRNDSQQRDIAASIRAMIPSALEIINSENNDVIQSYSAEARTVEQRIGDMKFPKNVIFFIKSLISWIGHVILYLIEKFKNLLRRLLGDAPKDLDPKKLQFKLTKVKEVEGLATNRNELGRKPIGVIQVDPSNFEVINTTLREGVFDSIATELGIIKKSDVSSGDVKTTPVLVSVDLSRDLMSIRELMQRFYELFDNAYGSNNEHLFQTDDLELILQIFNDTIKRVKDGSSTVYAYGGSAVEIDQINSNRISENLRLTNTNITNLKSAYVQTADKIKDIMKIIQSKELLMVNNLGSSYKMLSSGTYQQLIQMAATIPVRLKEAQELERALGKLKSQYDALAKQLAATQRNILAIGNVQYDTIYNRKMVELFRAASSMRDIVTLRLSGIGLYIKELKDVQDVMTMLVNFNKSSAS